MDNRENGSQLLTEHNNEITQMLRREIAFKGVTQVAREYKVNHYYLTKVRDDDNYVPTNTYIAMRLGYRVYSTTVPHGTPRSKIKRSKIKRATIYPGTSVDKIKADLLDVTGVRWAPLEDEMEY